MKTLITGALLGVSLALTACGGAEEESGTADDLAPMAGATVPDDGIMAAEPASGPAAEATSASEAGLAQPGAETSPGAAAEPPGSPGQDEAMTDAVVGGAAGDGGPPGP